MPRSDRIAALPIAIATAREGLSMYWRGAALAVLAATVALSAAPPVIALADGLDLGKTLAGLDVTWSPRATPVAELQRQALRALLAPLLAAAGGVLALAGITILAGAAGRAGNRAGEIGVRRAVGASRRALAMMAIVEAALLAGAAVIASAGFAIGAFQLAQAGWPGTTSVGALMPIALVVAAFFGTFLLGALFVLVPARQRAVHAASGPPLELYLAGALLSIGLIVLSSSALIARHVDANAHTGASLGGDGILYSVASTASSASERSGSYAALLAVLGGMSGVGMASIASPGVAIGLGEVGALTTDCGECFEANMRLRFRMTTAERHLVSADTFRAIGATVTSGRGITAADDANGARVAVVNRALATRHFQKGEPIGRRLQLGGTEQWYTVVGVVDEPPAIGFGAALFPRYAVYLSLLQHPATRVEVLIRGTASVDTHQIGDVIARHLAAGATTPLPIAEASLRAAQLAPLEWMSFWVGIQGWAAWIIAAMGTLILVQAWVGSLIPELGIRRAVGARQRAMFVMVAGRASLAGIGGVCCALWFGPGVWQGFAAVVHGSPAWDPALTLRYGVVLVIVAVGAALPGAWRAMHASPAGLVGASDG